MFKFFLAAPVERYRWRAGHDRVWAFGLCLLLALVLVLVLGLLGRQELLSS